MLIRMFWKFGEQTKRLHLTVLSMYGCTLGDAGSSCPLDVVRFLGTEIKSARFKLVLMLS